MNSWRKRQLLFLASLLLVRAGSVEAYELRTHSEITLRAFDASQGVKTFLEAVTIQATDTFDQEHTTPPAQLSNFRNTGTARDWMLEGAIREDDYQQHPRLEQVGCDPPRNPLSEIDR